MKKLIYKGLYEITSLVSNRFSIRLLTKFKLYLGIALLVIVSSCSKSDSEIIDDEKNGDEPHAPTCYLPYYPPEAPQESAKTSTPAEKQLLSTDL